MSKTTQLLRLVLCTSAMLGGGAAIAAAADHPNVQPGKWEITIETEMEGMPSRPGVTASHCIKPEEIKDSQGFAEQMQKQRGKCKISDFKQDGDKVSWSYACEEGPSGTSEYVFSGTSYEGTNKASMRASGKRPAMKLTQHIKGKRVGDC